MQRCQLSKRAHKPSKRTAFSYSSSSAPHTQPRWQHACAALQPRDMEAAASRTTLSALPLALLQSVLARLPVDARARACLVCRAWNAALAERSLWARLDLSPASGVAVAVTEAVLRAAAARAGGQLEELDLSEQMHVPYRAVSAVVTASGATLRSLGWCHNPSRNAEERAALDIVRVEALLRAAPQLRVFDVDVRCHTVAEASRLLRNEPPFVPLRMLWLTVKADEAAAPDEAAVLALAADVAGHSWLAELKLEHVPLTAASLDQLLDAALARRLRTVELWDCQLTPASVPACVRLLSGGLSRLVLVNVPALLDAPAALLLGNALRASTTLTSCWLCEVDLWDDAAAAVLLLGALTSHQSLRELDVSCNNAGTTALQAIAGAVLATLIAANAPALHTLDVSHCRLGDAGMGLLVDMLPQNNHLHTLKCAGNEITEVFMRNRLLPAVQANASLRKLKLIDEDDDEAAHPAIVRELQELVAARVAAEAPQ
jgi:hypothetical protein